MLLRWLLVVIPIVLGTACAPTGGPGRPSWTAGAWQGEPASSVPPVAAIPAEPTSTPPTARPTPSSRSDSAPIQLDGAVNRAAANCPCPPPVPPSPPHPGVYRIQGALLRTLEDDIINVARDTVLRRRETGSGPAYCTMTSEGGVVTRSGRDICLYDSDGDNLLDLFVVIGGNQRFYDTGPFPYTQDES